LLSTRSEFIIFFMIGAATMPVKFRLAELIQEHETNQSALARDSEVSIVTINAMARNRTRQVHLDTIDRLSQTLGVDPGALFARVPDEQPTKQARKTKAKKRGK
jgi:DNA-binding Xre family transcriptional regulator